MSAPHVPPRQALVRLAGVAALLLAPSLGGCFGGSLGSEAGPGALPGVVSMLNLTAYPGARFISQEANGTNVGFIMRPGNSATRTYETMDDRRAVRAHYEKFARTNGWSIDAPPPEEENNYSYTGSRIAELDKGQYHVSVQSDYGHGGYDTVPETAPPLYPPTSAPTNPPDADATPFPSPTPLPSPSAKPVPFRFRVTVYMN